MTKQKTEPEIDTLIVALKIINTNTKIVADILSKKNHGESLLPADITKINDWIKNANDEPRKVARLMAWYIAVKCLKIPEIEKVTVTIEIEPKSTTN